MKNVSLRFLAVVLVSAMFLAGCGLGKMVKKYPEVKYEVTPQVLQTHGGKISVTIKGDFPVKYFHKKATVNFTPELKYEGGSTPLKAVTLQGEKAVGDGIVIKKVEGGSFTYTDVIDYKPEMNVSELVVNAKASLGKKSKELGNRKLADGVIYTSERVRNEAGDIHLAAHGYEKETIVSEKGNIYFAYNKYDLNLNLPLNKDEANKAKLKVLYDFINRGWKIKNINIDAWASPEGELSLNEKLSDDRAKTGDKYVKEQIQKIKKEKEKANKGKKPAAPAAVVVKEETPFALAAKGEDFDGFMRALSASQIKDKKAIENVINSQGTKAQREKSIKDMTVIYQEIEDMLSVLRRSELTVVCYEPKLTDEQIAMYSTTSPDSLDVKELLYAATLTEDLNTKLKVYKNATTVYPEEWKGYNNAGYVSLQLGNVDEAGTFFEKANSLSPNNGMVLNNLGVVALYKKDYPKAKTYFESAESAGMSAGYNLGIVKIKEGDYAGALTAFSGKSCDYNVALAQLLSENNDGAINTLNCAKKDAGVYYLLAIAGARSQNNSLIYENVKKAIQEDASYRDQAKTDREFLKQFDNADFQNAIK